MFRIAYFCIYHELYSDPISNRHIHSRGRLCLRDGRLVHNSVDRRINSLEGRRCGALVPGIAVAVVLVESSDGRIKVSQIVLALNFVADVLLDAQVESLVIRVRLDAERPAARDVLDFRARVPVLWLSRLCCRVPGRSAALNAVAILGVGQDVEADLAWNREGRVCGIFWGVGDVSDRPVGWSRQRSWWTLAGESGRWRAVLLDVVHDRMPLAAL